jgi:hypothetical protein
MMMMGAVVVFKSNLPLYSMYESGGRQPPPCVVVTLNRWVWEGRSEEKKSELHIPPFDLAKKGSMPEICFGNSNQD